MHPLSDRDDVISLVRKSVRRMSGYVPGLQPKPGQRLVKLNTNENPYPPSPKVLATLSALGGDCLRLYPDPRSTKLRERAAALYGVRSEQVICGNGSDELLAMIMRTFVDEGDTVAYFLPSYSLYPVLAGMAAARSLPIPLGRAVPPPPEKPYRAKVFFLTTPHSPYGFHFPTAWIERLLAAFPGIVVADEAYADYAPESSLPLLGTHERLIVVRSLSKSYCLAGLRVGLAFASEPLVQEMEKVKDSYNISRLSQEAACAALDDRDHFTRTRERLMATRQRFGARLAGLGFCVLPSDANFLFAVPPGGARAALLYRRLLEGGFLVRYFDTPELADGLRISIGTDDEMDTLSGRIKEALDGGG